MRLLPAPLRWERVEIRGPHPLSRAQGRLEALTDGQHPEIRVRVRGDRVTAAVVPCSRFDLWVPVLKGRLQGTAHSVELVGVLRPSGTAMFGFAYPLALVAIGVLPSVDQRWAIIATALLSASVLWGIGPWFDRRRNLERRKAILGQMTWALAASA